MQYSADALKQLKEKITILRKFQNRIVNVVCILWKQHFFSKQKQQLLRKMGQLKRLKILEIDWLYRNSNTEHERYLNISLGTRLTNNQFYSNVFWPLQISILDQFSSIIVYFYNTWYITFILSNLYCRCKNVLGVIDQPVNSSFSLTI